MIERFVNKIFDTGIPFEEKVQQAFTYQYESNNVYKEWCNLLNRHLPTDVFDIPFLPVSFFKTHAVITGNAAPEITFESSSTTGQGVSKHFVNDVSVYKQSFFKTFSLFYGDIQNWCVIGLLPSYLERKNSSLVYMVNEMIAASRHKLSGFYLHDLDKLYNTLNALETAKQKTLLISVSFALLDFSEQYSIHLQHTIVMETGGMKGRGKEITRHEMHNEITKKLGAASVHAEYGMTELLSQAYSKGDGRFYCPPWMKVLVRNEEDPLDIKSSGRGVLNVIDIANLNSCSFIATDDVGIVYEDGSFEVAGRLDNSDIRGCSLLVV